MAIEFSRKQTFLMLASLVGIGAFLRFYKLDFQGLWYDELHSIIPTNPTSTFSSIVEYCKMDQPPAFFLYIHYVFKIFGYSEQIGKTAAALIGVLSIPAVYFLGRQVRSNTVGLGAAFILTFNYFSIYYSQELRFYSFAFLFTTLSFAFFIRAFQSNGPLDYLGYILSTVVLLYTHYFGIVIYATQVIIFVVICFTAKPQGGVIVKSAIAGVLVALAFVPWLPIVFSDLQIGSFWIQKPKALFIAEYFYLYLGKDFVLALVFVGFLFLFFRTLKLDRNNPNLLATIILLLWLILSYAIPLIRSLTSTPILHVRYTIVTLPAWIILFAWGWTLIPRKNLQYMFVGIIAMSSLVNIFVIRQHYSKIDKQQFREAAEVVISRNLQNLPVVSIFPWHYNFYFRGSPHIVGYDAIITPETNSFWLLPVQTFSATEIDNEIAKFPQFEIVERHIFNKTQAILLVKKPA
jgi:4-amino-4-deoxy-L-arabinose transferase-like glycosyltransferase